MLDIIEKENFLGQAETKGKRLLVKLKEVLGDHANVGDVRGIGMMCAVEYVEDRSTKQPFDASQNVGARINQEAIKRGLFSRVRGDVYLIAPPIVTTESTIDDLVDILAESTKAVLG